MKKFFALSIGFLSSFSIAQAVSLTSGGVSTSGVNNVNDLGVQLKNYFNLAIELMIAAAVAWVIWSAFKFVMSAGDEAERGKAREGIVYGIVGMAVMMSVWGLVGLVTRSTGLSNSAPQTSVPTVN